MDIMVLNDNETFTDLHDCKIVHIFRDAEDEPFTDLELAHWDEMILDYEASRGCEIWHDMESGYIGEVVTKFN